MGNISSRYHKIGQTNAGNGEICKTAKFEQPNTSWFQNLIRDKNCKTKQDIVLN